MCIAVATETWWCIVFRSTLLQQPKENNHALPRSTAPLARHKI